MGQFSLPSDNTGSLTFGGHDDPRIASAMIRSSDFYGGEAILVWQ